MPRYLAYGLVVDSDIELPELPEGAGTVRADIRITCGHVQRPQGIAQDSDDYVGIDDETVRFHTPHASFRIASGRELTVDAVTGASQESLRLAILGRALGAMLQWQGLFVLHASAVARGGRAIAFAGASGSGKSTTAAAFLEAGWKLVADDLVVIDLDSHLARVRPGVGQIKLWPDSASSLGLRSEDYDRVHVNHEKRRVPIDSANVADEMPQLAGIYILASAPGASRVEELTHQEGLVELLRHSYAPRIMRALGRQSEHLEQCARLAQLAAPQRLLFDRAANDPKTLPTVIEAQRRSSAHRATR